MAHVVCGAGGGGEDEKKKPSFLSKRQECERQQHDPIIFRALALRGSQPPACPPPPRGAPERCPTARTPALPERRVIAAGWVLGGRSAHASPFQAIVPRQSLILFAARGLWIYARFPSANDMRRDPSQLLLKCIRDIGSAERDGPCLSPGEN